MSDKEAAELLLAWEKSKAELDRLNSQKDTLQRNVRQLLNQINSVKLPRMSFEKTLEDRFGQWPSKQDIINLIIDIHNNEEELEKLGVALSRLGYPRGPYD